ncbi:endonuclease/exonuclease/phosphatase family protein [Actinomycetospora sp. NBC_00405]|uniref:endonuclease/exonuclease/phosphatase family protein n=1 Tax=Actinomycetospora sp. NBC_00405 TaxID=2975952 RepID=UPI002E1C8DF1
MPNARGDVAAPPSRRAPRGPWWIWLLLAVLPWTWFPLRDQLGLVGDVVAIVLPVLAVVAAVAALVVGRQRGLVAAVSVLVAGTVAVVGPWTPVDTGPVRPGAAVTVASANVTGLETTLPALRAAAADVLVVVEDTRSIDRELDEDHPHRVYSRGTPSVGVYSRFPVRLLDGTGPDLPGLRVAVDAPTPFVLYAMHVPRPWWTGGGSYQATPAEHRRLVVALADRVAHEPGPVVVAGDLNSTDRGRDYRLLADDTGLTDVMRDGWTGPTSVTQWQAFLLRIDHLMVGPGWCGEGPRRFPLAGSDHDGITAGVGPCA